MSLFELKGKRTPEHLGQPTNLAGMLESRETKSTPAIIVTGIDVWREMETGKPPDREKTDEEKLVEDVRTNVRNTIMERGAGYALNLTDVLYPLLISPTAVLVATQAAAFLTFFGALVTGVNMAMQHLVAKTQEANEKKARAYINQSVIGVSVYTVIVGLIIASFPAALLEWQGLPVTREGVLYFQTIGGCQLLLTGIQWNLALRLRAVGETESAKRAAILICGINLVLDPLLIFVAGLQLVGSALGTIIALVVGICYLWQCFRGSELGHIQASWKLDRSIQKELLKKAIPSMGREAAIRGELFLLNLLFVQLGAVALAAIKISLALSTPCVATSGLAAAAVVQTQTATLIGKKEKAKDSSHKEYEQVVKALRQEFERVVEICHETWWEPVKYGYVLWTLGVLIAAFVYMPLAETEAMGKWYLLAFFGAGFLAPYYVSKNTVLDLGLVVEKGREIVGLTVMFGLSRITLIGATVFFVPVTFWAVVFVSLSFTLTGYVNGILLRRLSATVLTYVEGTKVAGK